MMKSKVFLTALVAIVVLFTTPISTVWAADSISAYMGFSREVNEALAGKIQEKLGIEVKNITLSWGEIWARLMTESPRFNADMVLSFGASEAINGAKKATTSSISLRAGTVLMTLLKHRTAPIMPLGHFHFFS
jgi:hypothetical protein